MEDHLGREVLECALERLGVADVAANVVDDRADARHGEEVWLGGRIQCVPAHRGAELREPKRKPSSFETGVAGKKDAATLPGKGRRIGGVGELYHVFQGAFPELHSSSSCWRSRSVSMACQKP